MALSFWKMSVRRVEKKYRVVYKRGPSTIAMFFAGIAIAAWIVFLLSTGYPAFQFVYYTLRPSTSAQLAKVLQEVQTQPDKVVKAQESVNDTVTSNIDPSLPEGHYLTIPSIGVDTTIWEAPTADYEQAFRKGVWRVPEMAEPPTGTPVVLAAHRFGYLDWTQQYREKNSFFNLPKMNVGDEFEIIWDQRHYKYKVDKITEGEQIDDYNYDVILYTCKFLVSPVKYFVYARRVN